MNLVEEEGNIATCWQSLPNMTALERFDSGSSKSDRAPKWIRGSLQEGQQPNKLSTRGMKEQRRRLLLGTKTSTGPLLDDSTNQGCIETSHRRRNADSIPSTPKRCKSFEEPYYDPYEADVDSLKKASLANNRRRNQTSSRSSRRTGTRRNHRRDATQRVLRETTERLASEIVQALTKALSEQEQQQQQQQQQQNEVTRFPACLGCQACGKEIYVLSSCQYIQCPHCDTFNLMLNEDPVPFGVGFTYSDMKKFIARDQDYELPQLEASDQSVSSGRQSG